MFADKKNFRTGNPQLKPEFINIAEINYNNLFKKGQLNQGNSKESLELAYEVTKDLFAGMNKVSATVDGTTVKNAGRSTSDLFYFNQSRSKDYSQQGNANSAVALIDKNNTHVFFKAWDDIAYFR